MRLKTEIIKHLQDSHAIRSKIGLLTEKHPITIQQWVNKNANHGPLTGWSVLELIASEVGQKPQDIITDDEPTPPISIIR